MKTHNPFIAQTAYDYDMPYHEVERIKKLYPKSTDFYRELEAYIKQRAQRCG